MVLLLEFIIFVVSLAALVKSADYFVDSSAKIARIFGVSDFVIGLTIVAIGTSLPELITAITSSMHGNGALSVGNVIGANITNILLNLGLVAIFVVLQIKKEQFRRDVFFLMFCAVLFGIFAVNNVLSRPEGVVFLALFLVYMAYLLRFEKKKGFLGYDKYAGIMLRLVNPSAYTRVIKHSFRKKEENLTEDEKIFLNLLKYGSVLVLSGFFIYFSAEYMVDSAVNISEYLGVPAEIIGILMVAIGTSSPELVVSIRSAKKGLQDILVGNVVGSCIINLLLVAGTAMVINPVIISNVTKTYFVPFMIMSVILLIGFVKANWILKMFHGLIFVLLYALFVISLIFLL